MNPGPAAQPTRARPAGPLRWLPALTLVAVLTITATAEFGLARTVLDLSPYIAWALPVAIDSYVLAALRSGRDVLPALSVMAGALAASMGAHLSAEGTAGQPLPGHVVAPAATAIMVVLVIVAWRVHVLIEDPATATPPPATPAPATSPAPADKPIPADTGNRDGVPAGSDGDEMSSPGTTSAPRLATAPAGAVPDDESARPTDEEILAVLGADGAGLLPSVRGLMSAYGVGQRRATRLRRAAADAHNLSANLTSDEQHPNPEETSTSENQYQDNQKAFTTALSSTVTKTTQRIQNEEPEEPSEESPSETPEHEQLNTHTCITDRVGPPSPAGGPGSADGQSNFPAFPPAEINTGQAFSGSNRPLDGGRLVLVMDAAEGHAATGGGA